MTMHEVFCMHRTTVSKIRKQKLTGSEVAGKASAIILPALHRPWEAKTQQILKYSLPATWKVPQMQNTTISSQPHPRRRLTRRRKAHLLASLHQKNKERERESGGSSSRLSETFEGTIDPKDVRPSPTTRRLPPSRSITSPASTLDQIIIIINRCRRRRRRRRLYPYPGGRSS